MPSSQKHHKKCRCSKRNYWLLIIHKYYLSHETCV